MTLGLQKLAGEDPSLRLKTDQETGQTILSGMGELHLEIIIDRLKPRIRRGCPYRRPAGRLPGDDQRSPHTETYTHKKQSGGSAASTPRSRSIFEPRERNEGIEFVNKAPPVARCRSEYIPAVEKGIKVQADTGVLAGFPTVDFKLHPGRRQVPRRRFVGAGLRNRRPRPASAKA